MIHRVPRRYLFLIALLVILGLSAPLPYVLVEPGTPTNTLGKVKGKPVLEITGQKIYPTDGKLHLTSIWVTSPGSRLQTFELLRAWIDGERAVQPREVFYPKGVDPEQVNEESVMEMKNSQINAQLATLNYLKIDYDQRLVVKDFRKNSPNRNIVKKGDQIISFDGKKVISSKVLRAELAKTRSKVVELGVIRDGKKISIPITISTQVNRKEKKNVIGLYVSEEYDLPFTVKINLKNIGGPSAGLIFSLAMIEKLTKEDVIRGRNIAGTGTISPDGKVGPIGGIEEKLIGARREGVTLFLAPALNCSEIRHIPKGLQVVPVDTLTEALAALSEKESERLPMCG
jgi:PDZ domain-containing protein